MTAINVTIFYSRLIVVDTDSEKEGNTSLKPQQYCALIYFVNCIAALYAFFLLNKYGRRTLLLGALSGISVLLLIQAIVDLVAQGQTRGVLIEVILVLTVLLFEFGPGPICWIYMSEVMNDKGVAVGTSLIWTFTLIYSAFALCLNKDYIYFVLVAPCALATILVYYFVKETKGLSEYEL